MDGAFAEKEFSVPTVEPEVCRAHREDGAKAPARGEAGTVYARKGPNGPSEAELAAATVAWLKANKPEALDSKVEAMFRAREYGIVWTPPYCPKFQPIELVWGAAKQRASGMYYVGRDLMTTRLHLRLGFYGGDDGQGTSWKAVDVAGCWRTAEGHINAWIKKDRDHVDDGLSGTIDDLKGAGAWTETPSTCLNITDMDVNEDPRPVDVVGVVEVDPANDLEFDDGEEDSEEEGEA